MHADRAVAAVPRNESGIVAFGAESGGQIDAEPVPRPVAQLVATHVGILRSDGVFDARATQRSAKIAKAEQRFIGLDVQIVSHALVGRHCLVPILEFDAATDGDRQSGIERQVGTQAVGGTPHVVERKTWRAGRQTRCRREIAEIAVGVAREIPVQVEGLIDLVVSVGAAYVIGVVHQQRLAVENASADQPLHPRFGADNGKQVVDAGDEDLCAAGIAHHRRSGNDMGMGESDGSHSAQGDALAENAGLR